MALSEPKMINLLGRPVRVFPRRIKWAEDPPSE